MIRGHVFIATSLDGFIARPDGSIDWLESANATGEDHGFDTFVAGMDALLMGRETFQTVSRFEPWPYLLPVIVLSTTLDAARLPAGLETRVSIARTMEAAMILAASLGWQNLYVDGGETVRCALAAGLVRELVISRLPLLLGQGRPLFGSLPADILLRHVSTRSFASGIVQSRYEVPDQARPE